MAGAEQAAQTRRLLLRGKQGRLALSLLPLLLPEGCLSLSLKSLLFPQSSLSLLLSKSCLSLSLQPLLLSDGCLSLLLSEGSLSLLLPNSSLSLSLSSLLSSNGTVDSTGDLGLQNVKDLGDQGPLVHTGNLGGESGYSGLGLGLQRAVDCRPDGGGEGDNDLLDQGLLL